MNDEFLNNLGKWENENQTITDPFLTSLGMVTLDSYYNPIRKISKDPTLNNSMFINSPPGYLPCKIDLYYGGSYYKTIPILFPESISESLSSNFVKESPVGSSFPIVAFSNSQPTTIPITFTVLSDYLPYGYATLKVYLNDIKLLCKPRYSGNMVLSPSVNVTYSDISFYAICESVNIDYAPLYNNKSMAKATVSCNFIVTGGV